MFDFLHNDHFIKISYEPNFIYFYDSGYKELKKVGWYDFSRKKSFRVTIDYIHVRKN